MPLLVEFSSSVAASRSSAFRAFLFLRKEKFLRIYTSEYAPRGIRTHKLTCFARLEGNLIRHLGDRY